MIKAIKVTNFRDESLTIELANPEASSGLALIGAEGLGPVETDINITELATQDGAIYNSSRMQSREIRLSLMFVGTDIEAKRHLTYRYFPIKKKLSLAIKTDTREVNINGYVESNSPNIFSSREGTTITIICPDPKFYSVVEQKTKFSGTEALFEFPFESGRMLLMNQQIQPIYYANNIGNLSVTSSKNYIFAFSGVYASASDALYYPFGDNEDCIISFVPGHDYYISSKDLPTTGNGYFRWRLYAVTSAGKQYLYDVGDTVQDERQIFTFPETVSGNKVMYGVIALQALSTRSQEISMSGSTLFQLVDITEYYGEGFEPSTTTEVENELPNILTTGYEYETKLPKPNPYASVPNIEFGDMRSARELSILYNGDTDVGIVIEIHCIGPVENLSIFKVESDRDIPMRIDTSKLEELTGEGLVAGDTLYISTITGEKYIRLLRNSVTINVLNALDRDSTWFTLSSGDNVFTYTAEVGTNNVQFSISNKIAYEGV